MNLQLGQQGWPLNGELVRRLEDHLPNLRALTITVSDGDAGFPEFATTAGTTLPDLSVLAIHRQEPGELCATTSAALLALAVLRACNWLALRICVNEHMSNQQCDVYNAVVTATDDAYPVAFYNY